MHQIDAFVTVDETSPICRSAVIVVVGDPGRSYSWLKGGNSNNTTMN